MTTPVPVKPQTFTRSTLPPDPRPYTDTIIVLVEVSGARSLYVSNGASWVPVGTSDPVAVQQQIDLSLISFNAGLQSIFQAERAFATARANHTGTQLATSVVFAAGETLESQKVPFLTQGTNPSPDAPNLTAAPTITGTTTPGSTLTAAPGATTEGLGGSHTNIYQWQRVSLALGASDIFGATASTYVQTANDNGFKMAVKQTVRDAVTGILGNSRTSALTATVTGSVPTNAGGANLPALSPGGSATAGSQLYTSTTGTWANSPTSFGYQFYIAGAAQGTRTATATFTPNSAGPYGALTVGVIATNANGPSVEAISTTSVTVTAPVGTGHRWTNMTSAAWTLVEAEGVTIGDANASGYRSRVNGIPSAGGVTVAANETAIRNALAANDLVFVNSGSIPPLSNYLTLGTNKKLLAAPGATVNWDCSNGLTINMIGTNGIFGAGATGVMVMTNLTGNAVQMWDSGDGQCNGNLVNHVSVDGGTLTGPGAGIAAYYGSRNGLICSCEVMNLGGTNPGNTDGFNMAENTAPTGQENAFVDCHAFRNSDDGFDAWHSNSSQRLYMCTSVQNGKNLSGFNGDGNGYKCGSGSGAHNYFQCSSNDNLTYGWNRNANTVPPRLSGCSQTGDDAGPLAGGPSLYTQV